MKPLILISNDDSYAARGVNKLIEWLKELGEVVAVCPATPQSGKSMALTVNDPIRISEVACDGAKMYRVTGTPVDCIKLSMHYILDRKPDLVVAGINHGSNAAVNVFYSGTMGAAIEGALFGIPSVGFSLTDHSPNANFEPCRKAVEMIVKGMLQHGLPENVCLNVNIPNIDHTPKEMRLCEPCKGLWNDEYKEYIDPMGRKFYMLSGEFENLEPENTLTDEWALAHGIISVVPVVAEKSGDCMPEIPWLTQLVKKY